MQGIKEAVTYGIILSLWFGFLFDDPVFSSDDSGMVGMLTHVQQKDKQYRLWSIRCRALPKVSSFLEPDPGDSNLVMQHSDKH